MQMMRMFDRIGDKPERVFAFIQILRAAKAHANRFGRIAIGRKSGR